MKLSPTNSIDVEAPGAAGAANRSVAASAGWAAGRAETTVAATANPITTTTTATIAVVITRRRDPDSVQVDSLKADTVRRKQADQLGREHTLPGIGRL